MFEKSAKSSYQLSDERQHPFVLDTSLSRTYNLILEKIKATSYVELIENKDYWEIYVVYEDKEVTFYLIDEKNGRTRVVMLVYTPHKRGKARSMLRELIEEYKNSFEKYLSKYKYNPEFIN